MKKKRIGIVGWIGAAVGLFVLFGLLLGAAIQTPRPARAPRQVTPKNQNVQTPKTSPTAVPERELNWGEEAYYVARECCRKSLRSPSSASFSSLSSDPHTGWSPDGYYQWRVFGRVEAQNAFSAIISQNWSATVQLNTGRLEVVWLKIGSSSTGLRPPMRRAPGR